MSNEHFIFFIYVFVRLSPITLIAPSIFFSYISLSVRTFFTLFIALIIAFTASGEELKGSIGTTIELEILISEFFLGVVLSLGFHAVNGALHMMAQLVDIQMGISAGATFNPLNFQTDAPTGKLLSLVAVAVFFSTSLHYDFFFAFSEIFRIVPPGVEYTIGKSYFLAFGKLFLMGFILAGPVIIVLFLTDAALALISRSMPQAQIYFVALPLKIAIGFVMLSITIGLSQKFFYELLYGAFSTWDQVRLK